MEIESGTKKITFDITTRSFLRALAVIAVVVFLYLVRDIVAVVMFSVVVASAVDPAARWFGRWHIPRTISVILVYLIAFSVLAAAFYTVVPTILEEISSLLADAPSLLKHDFFAQTTMSFLPILPGSLSGIAEQLLLQLQGALNSVAASFFGAAAGVFGGVVSFLLLVVLSFYLSVQKNGIESFLRIVVPKEHESYILELWSRSRTKIGRWLQGQLLLGVLVGVLVFLGLTILRVRFAFLLAVLAAIFELIPIFGPVMAAIPAIIVAFFQAPALGLVTLVFYIVVQQFENHLIYPVVVRTTTGVPAVVVIIALIIGAKLGGLFGILLAVPLAVVLMEFLNDIAQRKQVSQVPTSSQQ
ncbi:MAG: AI-2E family transporter [Parcubacteria group bacterium]|nr:AI-2E family transporter [Parcubacteria group bacterium]